MRKLTSRFRSKCRFSSRADIFLRSIFFASSCDPCKSSLREREEAYRTLEQKIGPLITHEAELTVRLETERAASHVKLPPKPWARDPKRVCLARALALDRIQEYASHLTFAIMSAK
jgi:hypothetical protein